MNPPSLNIEHVEDIAFIRAIRENPEDDALRLVYADWLDEHGDPRGEFLRLQHSLIGLRKKDPCVADIRSRMEQLRAGYSDAWLACVDRVDRFTMLWTNDYCDFIGRTKQAGQPLRFVWGGHNQGNYFSMKRDWQGCYMYPVCVSQKKLYVIARMRIFRYMSRTDYLAAHPEDAQLIRNQCAGQVLVAATGSPIRFDIRVPPPILTELRFRQTRGEDRALKINDHGQLAKGVSGLDMICRLTARSAQDFDSLIDGDYQPPAATDQPWFGVDPI